MPLHDMDFLLQCIPGVRRPAGQPSPNSLPHLRWSSTRMVLILVVTCLPSQTGKRANCSSVVPIGLTPNGIRVLRDPMCSVPSGTRDLPEQKGAYAECVCLSSERKVLKTPAVVRMEQHGVRSIAAKLTNSGFSRPTARLT